MVVNYATQLQILVFSKIGLIPIHVILKTIYNKNPNALKNVSEQVKDFSAIDTEQGFSSSHEEFFITRHALGSGSL